MIKKISANSPILYLAHYFSISKEKISKNESNILFCVLSGYQNRERECIGSVFVELQNIFKSITINDFNRRE